MIEFHINHFASGSIPDVGSSRTIKSGFPSKAIAIYTFHLLPPERFIKYVFVNS